MSRPIEALAEEVLLLPTEARTRLLDRIVASLDADRARDAAWDAVAAERAAELDSRASQPVDARSVVERLRAGARRAAPEPRSGTRNAATLSIRPACS
jgi:hypothetical protein